MARFRCLVFVGALTLLLFVPRVQPQAQSPAAPDRIERELRAVVESARPGVQGAAGVSAQASSSAASSAAVVDAAGLTRSGRRLWAIEPSGSADGSRPKLVLVGGLDGDTTSADEVLRYVRWWFTAAAAAPLRARWEIAALPCARPDACGETPTTTPDAPLSFPPPGGFFDGKLDPTPHYLWRWTTMQAPTVVIEVAAGPSTAWQANALARAIADGAAPAIDGSLAGSLGGSGTGPAWSRPVPALRLETAADGAAPAISDVLSRAANLASPLHTALGVRQSRAPLDVARLLAPKYPAQAIMSYIPALAWSGALRLAHLTGEARFREKPLADLWPFLSGQKPTIAEPYLLTSLAGHLALSDLGDIEGNAQAAALAQRGADFILPQGPGEIVRVPRGWTDDMFMATSVLARVGARAKDDRYGAAAGRLLTSYATELQRPDGIFVHAKEGPHAWGRGNGFAAFGMMEALTYLPESWRDRARVLARFQAHMKGLVAHQAADGMWRQVVDEPGSYRELTVTAMVLAAMARGVRLGWLDPSYRPVVDRAWRGLLARIAEDGTLLDVCTGTGSGPTKEYYLNRAGVTGADDRGGAMALTAALEVEELARASR